MKKIILFSSVSISFLLFTACANPFGQGGSTISSQYGPVELTPLRPAPSVVFPTGVSMISANINRVQTGAQRHVTLSVGTTPSQIVTSSTGGRKIFMNVQGQMFADGGQAQ